jgi:hypothetical protein
MVMHKLIYFEAITWQRLLTLTESGTVPTAHTDQLRQHLERLVAAISVLRLAPAWRKRSLANEAENILSTIDEHMRPYRELLGQLRIDEERGRAVKRTRQGLEVFVRTWAAIRRDARAILRGHGWREQHSLRLAHSVDRVHAVSSLAEGLHFVKAWGEATKGVSREDVKQLVTDFFGQRECSEEFREKVMKMV